MNHIASFFIIATSIFLTSCGGSGKTSVAQDYFETCLNEESEGRLKLNDFNKTNGYDSKGISGQEGCVIEFEAVIEPTQTVRKANCGNLRQKWCWDHLRVIDMNVRSRNLKLVKGEEISLIGKVYLRDTENGWRGEGYKIGEGKK